VLTLAGKCRVCSRESLRSVVDLGEQYLSGQFVRPLLEEPVCPPKYPLEMVRCTGCGLVQLRHTVNPEALFRRYWYRSDINDTMRCHLQSVAAETLGDARTVLDIGCNDGTLLRSLRGPIERAVGIDPSDAAKDLVGVYRGFFPQDLPLSERDFDRIYSLACFYDVEQPVRFAESARDCLSPRGVWVIEVAYLVDILQNHAYDTICHEHLLYFSFESLQDVLERAGLQAFKVRRTKTNGGSILVQAARYGSHPVDESVGSLYLEERRFFGDPLHTIQVFQHFAQGIDVRLDELHSLLWRLHEEGSRIHVYGASTKGNVILQSADVAEFVECCADRNPQKWGCRTLGTDLPIISEEESRKLSPDYYLVLPWAFRDEFVERERSGGIPMIFPLPNVSVWDFDQGEQKWQKLNPVRSRPLSSMLS